MLLGKLVYLGSHMPSIFRVRGVGAFVFVAFINAFVDLGHKILIQNTVFKVYEGGAQVALTSVINALILLPFVILFVPAGRLSDRYPKHHVMRLAAALAVVITLVITYCYYAGWFWPAFVLTLLLAAQSALYSPAKYSYIKLLVGKELLTAGNGLVQAVTIIAILGGSLFFSGLFEQRLLRLTTLSEATVLRAIAPLGWLLVIGSVVETWLAWRLPDCDGTTQRAAVKAVPVSTVPHWRKELSAVMRRVELRWPIIGVTIFMCASQLMLAAFPAFAEEYRGLTSTLVVQAVMAASGIGIVVGSILAARWSRHGIEQGLVPIGAIGLGTGLLLLPLCPSVSWLALNFLVVGIAGGLLIVPLNALMQYHAGEREIGRVIAGNNLVQNVFMLTGLLLVSLVAFGGLETVYLLYATAIATVASLFVLVTHMPSIWWRWRLAYLTGKYVRTNVVGLDRLPERQGVILATVISGPHDALVVQMTCPRRISWLPDWPVSSASADRLLEQSLSLIRLEGNADNAVSVVEEHLRRSELVYLPAGMLARWRELPDQHYAVVRAKLQLHRRARFTVDYTLMFEAAESS